MPFYSWSCGIWLPFIIIFYFFHFLFFSFCAHRIVEPWVSAVNGQSLQYQTGCIWITNSIKKQVNLQATVCIDSVLNMHSEDLLSSVDRSVMLDKRHQKGLYPAISPPLLSTLGSTIKTIHHCGIQSKKDIKLTLRKCILGDWNENKMLFKHLVKVKKGEDCRWHNLKLLSAWNISYSMKVW